MTPSTRLAYRQEARGQGVGVNRALGMEAAEQSQARPGGVPSQRDEVPGEVRRVVVARALRHLRPAEGVRRIGDGVETVEHAIQAVAVERSTSH